jgi:predicted HicB family RNase H-like nuclease
MADDQTLSEQRVTGWVTVPMPPELREQIKRAADADHRSVASWARVALIERLASQERAA